MEISLTRILKAISANQLTQCSGSPYDQIKKLIQDTENEATIAEEDDDAPKCDALSKYKLYLERRLKERKILERADDISADLTSKLQGRNSYDSPELFHISAAEYMQWIKRDKLIYRDQPALSPLLTGVPRLRQFLYNLPAQRNLDDYARHINFAVPAFLDKMKRIVTQSDRDVGFRTIADDIDRHHHQQLKELSQNIRVCFATVSKSSVAKFRADSKAFKQRIDGLVKKNWCELKGPTFNKILKNRGTIAKGTSCAKGLESGCNWNEDLAAIISPGFSKWYALHREKMHGLRGALEAASDQIYYTSVSLIENCAANLITVEKAKRRWKQYQHKMLIKFRTLMKNIEKEEKRLLLWANIEDKRENNLIALLTDEIYDEVYNSAPELKETPPGKPKRYVRPKVKYQKEKMEDLLLKPNDHFVDRAMKSFQQKADATMVAMIEKTFGDISEMLSQYTTGLRDHAPIDYVISPDGESIRMDLQKVLPALEEHYAQLKSLLPIPIKQEDNAEVSTNAQELGASNKSISELFEQINQNKRGISEEGKSRTPHIKKERDHGSKRVKFDSSTQARHERWT